MAKSVVILLALIGYASAAVIPSSQGKAAPFCNTAECIPPNCRCMSTDIPGGLTKEETPQVIEILISKYHHVKTNVFHG